MPIFFNNSFRSSPIIIVDKNTNKKKLAITVNSQKYEKNIILNNKKNISKSLEDPEKLSKKKSYILSTIHHDMLSRKSDFKPYDAMLNCKSAGIIPYTIYQNTLFFLFQREPNPIRKKDLGWNDFGGKRLSDNETTMEAAAREFSEETSCLFYLLENIKNNKNVKEYSEYYDILKNNGTLLYDNASIQILKNLISLSQKYFTDKINEFVLPIYISSKETYISYFLKVEYIPEIDIPEAEDFHIPYEIRYHRQCKWISFNSLIQLDDKDFHKRLQITRIKQRIVTYNEKGLFI